MHKDFLSLRLNPQRKNRNWSLEIYILPIPQTITKACLTLQVWM